MTQLPDAQAQAPKQQPPALKQQPQQQPPAPKPAQIDRNGVLILIRETLLALDQANKTGNYTVLRDLGAPTAPHVVCCHLYASERTPA